MEEVKSVSFLLAANHLRCKLIVFRKKHRQIFLGQSIIITRLCNNRLNGNLLESKIRKMQYVIGKIGIIIRICSTHIIALLITALCQFLELRDDQIVASRTLAERSHTVMNLLTSVNT